MIKLLIVDDEQVEREGLEAILKKAFPGLAIRQAKNGKAAVRVAGEFMPDIILMDIKMPGMSGLEAVEQISTAFPETKFVMVTAYDTFEYARQAIKLGVKDYLLKPSKASEIIATVGNVLAQIQEEWKETSHQQATLRKALALAETDIVTQLLFDHVHEVHLDMLVEMLGIRSTDEQFVMSVLLPAGGEGNYAAIKEKVRITSSCWVGALYGRQLPIIVFRDQEIKFRSQAVSLANEILSLAKSGDSPGWFVGIGNPCRSLNQTRQSYQESLIATMDPNQPRRFRFYSDVPVLDATADYSVAKQREKQFFDQIRLGKWDELYTDFMELIRRYENESADLVQIQQRMLELLWIASRIMSEIGVEAEFPLYSFQASDYRQLRAETGHLLERMRQSYLKHYNRLEADTIQTIKKYIVDHSHKDISLEYLGKKVGLSPIYISKMFKEKLGINYIDFLTECRMEKAKKLMVDPEKSLKEITFEVGYHEPNYFSKVFKKMYGLSPTEYRRTLLWKKG
ncbi:response regulator [Bacillus sp. FJAT-27245]|uniref:response regulator n=1 Tax=Bacillus sp. FJAT-27245 TaxID=1684144 RepID=UPI0006A7F042|nr:response regulator [Bacillus sp. FJAT-27245]